MDSYSWWTQTRYSLWQWIHLGSQQKRSNWQNVPGRLKQIDGGYGYVYGVNSGNAIYTRPVDGSGTWRRIPGSLKHVTASGRNEIFGVNNNNNLYRCKKPCIGEWELVDDVYMTQCDATFDSFVGIRVQSQNYKHVTGQVMIDYWKST